MDYPMNSFSAIRLLLILAIYFQANIPGMVGITRSVIIYMLYAMCCVVFITTCPKFRPAPEIPILFGAVVLLLHRAYMHQFSGSFQNASYIILPALIVYLIPQANRPEGMRLKQWCRKFIVTFYIVECSIAILEFVTHRYLFGHAESAYGDGKWHFEPTEVDFRSVSICGSPLNNALVVVIINAFILFSSLPDWKKTLCFLLGLLAVFTFNARASLVLFVLTGILYGVRNFGQSGAVHKIRLLLLAFAAVILVLVAIFHFGLASRMMDTDIERDGSIGVRLKLFYYFSQVSLTDYLWGMSMDNVQKEMDIIGVVVIENFWIGFMMLFGLIPLAYFTVCYFRLGKRLFDGYETYAKWVLFVIFIVNASINNSMFSNYSPLLTFLLCTIAFKEKSMHSEICY